MGSDFVSEDAVNPRIDMINSLFPDTWCVFEKLEVQRMVYYLIFNLACTTAQIYFTS